MTECFSPEVRDFLPDLVHDRLGDLDAATLAAHVEACEACAGEVALLREVRKAAPLAPSINVDRIVALLPVATVPTHVVDAPPRSAVLRGSSLIWKLLAAVAIVLTGGILANRVDLEPDAVVRSGSVPVSAPVPQATATPAAGGSSLSLVSGVQDLTDDQIETLLAQLDDVDAIPSLEPEQAVIPAVDAEPAP